MNYERISELYGKLAAEQKKVPVDKARIDEINYWLDKEFAGKRPTEGKGTLWVKLDKFSSLFFPLPSNWKIYVTSAISAFVALNSQVHLVSADAQNTFLAAAISLGFWAVNSTQNINYGNIKTHLASLSREKK